MEWLIVVAAAYVVWWNWTHAQPPTPFADEIENWLRQQRRSTRG